MHLAGTGDREPVDATVKEIPDRLERGDPPPLGHDLRGEICVFVSGHTHAPSLTEFHRGSGSTGAIVNSGCWLRQLQPIGAHFRAPAVYVGRFVQAHVRLSRSSEGIEVELWEHPRPSPQRIRAVERLAIAGRLPREQGENRSPRVRARATVRDRG
jgi:hypothetical protein